MSRWLSPLLALLLVVSLAAGAAGYSVSLVSGSSPMRWNVQKVPYVVHQSGSADIGNGSDIAAVDKGFSDWQAVGCSYLQFLRTGTTTNKRVTSVGGASNNVNEVVWIENGADEQAQGVWWSMGGYVLGVTAPIFYQDGTIIEADIAFNGAQQTWSTNGQPGFNNGQDVLNVAIHEEGHFFGLQHVLGGYDPNNPPTMAPQADPYLATRTLEPDDKKGICFLYPASGAFSCSGDDDCPFVVDKGSNGQEFYAGKVKCQGGSCGGITTPPPGNKGLGEACVGDIDCASPLFCQQSFNGSLCAQKCVPNQAGCPQGFDCVAYSNSPGQGVCLPGNGGGGGPKPGSKKDGESCEASVECASQLCVGSATSASCRRSCNPGSPGCPAGQTCASLSSGGGACVPGEQGGGTPPGSRKNGEVCEGGQQCQSGLCVGDTGGASYYCRAKCNASSGTGCPEGQQCVGLVGDGSQGACIDGGGGGGPGPTEKGTGADCEDNGQCSSGQCVSMQSGASSFCTASCVADGDCPCGMECASTNLGKLCVPGAKKGCVPDGNACGKDGECASASCVDAVCARKCDLFAGGCPSGQACLRAGQGSSGHCKARGSALPGAPCGGPLECSTLLCASPEGSSVCLVPCDLALDTPCGPGFVCADLGGVGGCLAGEGGQGIGPGADTGQGPAGVDATGGGADAAGGGPGLTTDVPAPGSGGGGGGASGCSSGGPGSAASPGLLLLVLLVLLGLAGAFRRRRPVKSGAWDRGL